MHITYIKNVTYLLVNTHVLKFDHFLEAAKNRSTVFTRLKFI